MPDWRVIARAGRDWLGEGPLWSDRDNALYWVDILGPRVNRLDFADNRVHRWDMPEPIGWLIERDRHSGFIAGFASGFAELDLDPFAVRPIADPQPGHPTNRMNDAKADCAGRIFAGTKAEDGTASGAMFRLDVDRQMTEVDCGYRIANGPAIDPAGGFLYHTDSAVGQIYRMAILPDGTLGQRTLFLQFRGDWGAPDGMTIDAEGYLWVAHWGGARVSRFGQNAALDRVIALPASQITSCTFAGANLDRMFVTSAADGVDEEFGGALFEVDPGVRGLPTLRFGG